MRPTTAPAAHSQGRELGIDNAHPLVTDLWTAVLSSCEVQFYSEADWCRLRLELWNANQAMTSHRPISGHTWAGIQRGLNELLISLAAKRRAAIEMRPAGPDADENAAVSMMSRYRQSLKPVD